MNKMIYDLTWCVWILFLKKPIRLAQEYLSIDCRAS